MAKCFVSMHKALGLIPTLNNTGGGVRGGREWGGACDCTPSTQKGREKYRKFSVILGDKVAPKLAWRI